MVDVYVRLLGDAMGLKDWEFVVSDEPADDGTIAEISCTFGQRHAIIYLCENWLELDLPMQRETLVHEMVHAHLSQMRHMMEGLFAEVKGGKMGVVSMHLLEEYATENIAQAWAALLPLPESTIVKEGL